MEGHVDPCVCRRGGQCQLSTRPCVHGAWNRVLGIVKSPTPCRTLREVNNMIEQSSRQDNLERIHQQSYHGCLSFQIASVEYNLQIAKQL